MKLTTHEQDERVEHEVRNRNNLQSRWRKDEINRTLNESIMHGALYDRRALKWKWKCSVYLVWLLLALKDPLITNNWGGNFDSTGEIKRWGFGTLSSFFVPLFSRSGLEQWDEDYNSGCIDVLVYWCVYVCIRVWLEWRGMNDTGTFFFLIALFRLLVGCYALWRFQFASFFPSNHFCYLGLSGGEGGGGGGY